MAARTCRYHCRADCCDSCFSSLSAFEAHRAGPFTARYCDLDEETFTGREGICKVSQPGEAPRETTIWTLTADVERAMERLP